MIPHWPRPESRTTDPGVRYSVFEVRSPEHRTPNTEHPRPMPLSPRTRDLIFLSIVCFICFFWRLGAAGLFDFNEGYYTSVAREMYLRGDYITPRFNGTIFFDKPPLALWLSAISFRLFGVNEF